jgi:hypothetical protein
MSDALHEIRDGRQILVSEIFTYWSSTGDGPEVADVFRRYGEAYRQVMALRCQPHSAAS